MTSILSKFTKPVSTQPNFGGSNKYSSGLGKSYLWDFYGFLKEIKTNKFQKTKFTLFFNLILCVFKISYSIKKSQIDIY